MALCHQAISHYFSNCWPRSMALFPHLMRICCLLYFSHSPIHRQLLIIKRGGPLSHPYAPYGVPHPIPRAWRCPNPRHSSHLPPERRAVPRPHQLHCVNTMWCWSLWHVSNYTARWMEGWCLYCFINSSPPGQNGCHFTDGIFKCIFINEKFCILIQISLKFVLKSPIDDKSGLVQVMAWHLTGDKSLLEPILFQFTDAYMWL